MSCFFPTASLKSCHQAYGLVAESRVVSPTLPLDGPSLSYITSCISWDLLLFKMNLDALLLQSSFFAYPFRTSGLFSLVLVNRFLVIFSCWPSIKEYFGRSLCICVTIVSSKSYSNYCMTAAMIWASTSLLVTIPEELTGSLWVTFVPVPLQHWAHELQWRKNRAMLRTLKQWRAVGGLGSFWNICDLSQGRANVFQRPIRKCMNSFWSSIHLMPRSLR